MTLFFGLLVLLLRCSSYSYSHALSTEGLALLSLKMSANADESAFSNWKETDLDPCHWSGITCSILSKHFPPSVISISLPTRNLSGQLPIQLAFLPNLRRINLRGNNLSGPIPQGLFHNASAIRSIFLHNNNFSGPLPDSICTAPHLQNLDLSNNSLSGEIPGNFKFCKKLQRLILAGNGFTGEVPAEIWTEMKSLETLDLSNNELNGSIPDEIGKVSSLAGELNLSSNHFTGNIPESLGKLPITVKIDLSNNNLSGEIPHFNERQEAAAFANNPMLCGFPLEKSCAKVQTITGSSDDGEKDRKGLELVDIVLIAVAHFILVACLVVGAIFVCKNRRRGSRKCACPWRRMSNETRSQASASHCSCIRAEERASDTESIEDDAPHPDADDNGDHGRVGELVSIDREFKYDIDELLQASAYVLGMNARGIVYKVVLGNGVPVVVRRLGSGSSDGLGYKEFAADVIAVGRVKHPNVVRVRAFYWTCDEKLLISDFIPNGNLASALQGRSGQQQKSLPWSARLKIAKGTAAGLAFIHECSPRKFMHQRIKPTNILLDHDLNPYISDFGLNRLIAVSDPTDHQPLRTNESSTYAAPESLNASNKATQKGDVYSFGVVLLQLLTGRNPEVPQTLLEELSLAKWARKGLRQGNKLSSIIDPMLLNEVTFQKDATTLLQLALACTEDDPELRPKMKLVSENLQQIANAT